MVVSRALCQKFLRQCSHPTRGAALILIVFFFVALSVAAIQSAVVRMVIEVQANRTVAHSDLAYFAAESGLEDVFYRTATGKNVPEIVHMSLLGASSTVQTEVLSATEKQVYAFGQSDTGEVSKNYFKLSAGKSSFSLVYGALVGDGGITLGRNVTISGAGSRTADIYTNGWITSGAQTTINGNVTSAYQIPNDTDMQSRVCDTFEYPGSGPQKIAQRFVMSGIKSLPLASIGLLLDRQGTITNPTVRIVRDNGGVPGATLASQVVSSILIPTTGETWTTVSFSTSPLIESGGTYWIVVESAENTAGTLGWCRSNSDTYMDGVVMVTSRATPSVWDTPPMGEITDMTFTLQLGNPELNSTVSIGGLTIAGTARGDVISNATIKGDAYFKVLTDDSSVLGSKHPGSPTPPPVPLPFPDAQITQWETDATNGGVIVGNCTNACFEDQIVGTKVDASGATVPLIGKVIGPTKIDGNLTMSGGTFYLMGTVYVTGNVKLGAHSKVQCAPSFGSNSCIVIAGGYVDAIDQATFGGSGAPQSFLVVISTKKGCLGAVAVAGCGANGSAIRLSDNVSGAIFYAADSLVDVSNNADAHTVVGYMVKLDDNVKINYDPAEASIVVASDAGGTVGAWTLTRWSAY